jgi:hypothetical protein
MMLNPAQRVVKDSSTAGLEAEGGPVSISTGVEFDAQFFEFASGPEGST